MTAVRQHARCNPNPSICRLAAKNGCVSAYLHAGPAPGLGRMGALLALESGGPPLEGADRSAVEELGRQLAMHAVAMKPPYLDRSSGVVRAPQPFERNRYACARHRA